MTAASCALLASATLQPRRPFTRDQTIMRCVIFILTASLATSHAWADGHTLHNSRLTFLFGSTTTGYLTADADRVDAITWVNSAGVAVANFITQAVPECGDPLEFFGEAYGNAGGSRPYAVVRGVASNWTGTGASKGTTSIKALTACGASLDATTKSSYELFTDKNLVNALKITRSFSFITGASSGDMRVYLARVPLANYPMVVYPDSTNAVQSVTTNDCGLNCVITDWNGKWMAEDTGAGQGIAIFRKPNAAFPAEITIDYDSDSASNASAITLITPAAGWSGIKVSETEYLCFYDATSWTAAHREAGVPPTGCGGVPH